MVTVMPATTATRVQRLTTQLRIQPPIASTVIAPGTTTAKQESVLEHHAQQELTVKPRTSESPPTVLKEPVEDLQTLSWDSHRQL